MASKSATDFSLDILSASQFPDSLPGNTALDNDKDTARILYGGLVFYDEHSGDCDGNSTALHEAVPSSNGPKKPSPAKKTKRKPKSTPVTNEDDPSKKRGRPRRDTQDETATERRRTQIRLAQRAYRLRKEETISSLTQRVAELENTVEEMSRSFLAFNDDAMNSGVLFSQPELAQHLRRTTERFLSLAKASGRDSERDGDSQSSADQKGPPAKPGFENEHNNNYRGSLGSDGSDAQLSRDTSSSSPHEPSVSSTSSGFHESKQVLPPNDTIISNTTSELSDAQDWVFEPLPHMDVNSTEATNPNLESSFQVSRPLGSFSPYTYNYNESTFARRLHRTCLQSGFDLLTNPSTSPDLLNSKFKFTFSLAPKRAIIHALQCLLQRGIEDPLEFGEKPFFNVGGAGTHYPRRDHNGNIVQRPNIQSPERAFGPLTFQEAERPHPYTSVDEVIEAIGYDGEWFDCYDVEGYLLEKGIALSSRSSLVNFELPTPELSPGSYECSSSSPHISTGSDGQEFPPDLAESAFGQLYPRLFPEGVEAFEHHEVLKPPQAQDHTTGQRASSNTAAAAASTRSSCSFTLDVDRFINKLSSHGRCLGRAPSFRRCDVDASLASSLVHAW